MTTLFPEPAGYRPAQDPPWFTAGKNTPASHIANVRRGLHPFGFRLNVLPDVTCGTCGHHFITAQGRSQWQHKCRKTTRTNGPGTDLRVKWRGCEHWKAEEA